MLLLNVRCSSLALDRLHFILLEAKCLVLRNNAPFQSQLFSKLDFKAPLKLEVEIHLFYS